MHEFATHLKQYRQVMYLAESDVATKIKISRSTNANWAAAGTIPP